MTPYLLSDQYQHIRDSIYFCSFYSATAPIEDQIYMTLDEYIKIEMADLNKLLGKAGCDKAVVLINRHDVSNEELARNDEKFLVYGKNMEEVICAFCAS